MARHNAILTSLLDKGEITWKPKGNSMTPKIDSGDQVVIKKVSASACRVGDIVYCKVKGSYYLHLLSAIDTTQERYQISNNHGHVNGWIGAEAIFGVCVQVKDKILLSDWELAKRQAPIWCPTDKLVCQPPPDWNGEFPFICVRCKHTIGGMGG